MLLFGFLCFVCGTSTTAAFFLLRDMRRMRLDYDASLSVLRQKEQTENPAPLLPPARHKRMDRHAAAWNPVLPLEEIWYQLRRGGKARCVIMKRR